MRYSAPLLLLAASLATPALADDRSYLTAFLEDNLSGAGRQVTVTGFAGALSSRATITQLTIADDQGVWLTLDDVVLDWSRTAILSGAVIVNELTAAKITLARLPVSEEEATTPEAGTFEFALPELPVSIDIGKISAPSIVLGPEILGEAVEASFAANLHLSGGSGTAALDLTRIDAGPQSQIALQAGYTNETSILMLSLRADEAQGGLLTRKLDLPGQPATALSLVGQGRLDDFSAMLQLESDGETRLSGPVRLTGDAAGNRGFTADVTGNPAPLFLPEYAEFLGENLVLNLAGDLFTDGRIALSRLSLKAQALALDGRVELAADGLPDIIDLKARIAQPDGKSVLLPISGPNETRVNSADLDLAFDASRASRWELSGTVLGLDRPDLRSDRISLAGSGVIDRQGGRGASGVLDFGMSGLGNLAPEVLTALGRDLTGRTAFAWREGDQSLNLPEIALNGAGFTLNGDLQIEGLDGALNTSGQMVLNAADLSRFSGLAGRPLAGSGVVTLAGSASPLTGAFDAKLDVVGQGLKSGIAEADRLLAGRSTIAASITRDTAGLRLNSFDAKAASLHVTGAGKIATAGSDLSGTVNWGNLADLGGPYGGALSVQAGFSGTPQNGRITVSGTGNGLRIGQAEVDRLIAGKADLSGELRLENGAARLVEVNLSAPNLSAEVAGDGNDGAMRVSGRIRDLALIAPEFPGALVLSGRVVPQGQDYTADLRIQGPAGIDGRLNGRVTGTPDITLSGTTNASLANGFTDPVTLSGAIRYDVRLAGGWTPQNVSGRATLSGGTIAIPARGLSLDQVAVAADMAGGQVRLTATGAFPRGGRVRVEGPVGMAAPFNAGLSIRLDRVQQRDPELYDTTFDGDLTLEGPLMGRARLAGTVVLDQTELRVPSTGFASAADLEAVRHVNDNAAVRVTRARAGVGVAAPGSQAAGNSTGIDWLLDLVIRAPNRVFVRGRGLDAELGGEIRVGGSIQNIVPAGGLDLVRGRLDILGKRLTLDQASLVMEGNFIPYLTVSASNTTDSVTSIVSITGPANEPVVTFSSDPEMAQEEVLAWLLFGRGLDTISAFQAAQLANAVATLAGRGGEGIMSKLRRGFGFDDLDVNTAADGSTSVSAGKYISENVYTEIGVGANGQTRINLNLDVKPGVTVKGRVDSDGSSGLGIFLEKDY